MSHLKRHIGQKVALATAVFSALLALPAFGLFIWFWLGHEPAATAVAAGKRAI